MVIASIGTTIAPWMQFYLQASIVEKGVTARGYKASRLDVILGCIFTDIVAWFIIVACAATLYTSGHTSIENGADAARALKRPSRLHGGATDQSHGLRDHKSARSPCASPRSPDR